MATTKIWSIKSCKNIQIVIDYVENPEKTTEEVYRLRVDGKRSYSKSDTENMTDVMEYAMNDTKTEERKLVSGVNLSVETARKDMMITKKQYGKTDGILLWHGYQSFKPGEVTPEEAHRIGVEMAKKLWGDEYEVIVATHIDRKHIHNHFVINSVSFATGKKLDVNWHEMKRESDRLCELYGKSVIKEPKGRGRNYGEYVADKENRFTWKSAIKKEVDEIIDCSKSMDDFFSGLKKRGYSVKIGKYLTLQPPGKERGMRIDRVLGADYSVEGIAARIIDNVNNFRVKIPEKRNYRCVNRVPRPRHRTKGFMALYYFYCYKLGVFEKRGYAPRTHYLYREELRNIDKISAETRFLARNNIVNTVDLKLIESRLINEINGLLKERNTLRNSMRSMDEITRSEANSKVGKLNESIKIKRKELGYCTDISERSRELAEKKEKVRQMETSKDEKEKEV